MPDLSPARLKSIAIKVNWPALLYNRVAQFRHPEVKVFVIGFNKCGTSTLHHFFRNHGLKSLHWRTDQGFLAQEVAARLGDLDQLRAYLDPWTVFSDFNYLDESCFVETQQQFRVFAELYPDAYFLFNDRDVDKWLTSRLRHDGGSYIRRFRMVRDATEEEVVAEWRQAYIEHKRDVLSYFAGHPRFIHWSLDGSDADNPNSSQSPDVIVQALADCFRLDLRYWAINNKTGN